MRISDCSSDVCSSDLRRGGGACRGGGGERVVEGRGGWTEPTPPHPASAKARASPPPSPRNPLPPKRGARAELHVTALRRRERQGGEKGKRVSGSVDLGGRGKFKQKKNEQKTK